MGLLWYTIGLVVWREATLKVDGTVALITKSGMCFKNFDLVDSFLYLAPIHRCVVGSNKLASNVGHKGLQLWRPSTHCTMATQAQCAAVWDRANMFNLLLGDVIWRFLGQYGEVKCSMRTSHSWW